MTVLTTWCGCRLVWVCALILFLLLLLLVAAAVHWQTGSLQIWNCETTSGTCWTCLSSWSLLWGRLRLGWTHRYINERCRQSNRFIYFFFEFWWWTSGRPLQEDKNTKWAINSYLITFTMTHGCLLHFTVRYTVTFTSTSHCQDPQQHRSVHRIVSPLTVDELSRNGISFTNRVTCWMDFLWRLDTCTAVCWWLTFSWNIHLKKYIKEYIPICML